MNEGKRPCRSMTTVASPLNSATGGSSVSAVAKWQLYLPTWQWRLQIMAQ